MAEFKIDTGWSVFDIYLSGFGEPAGCSFQYGSARTLLNVSVSNSGRILDMGLIYADRIHREDTTLPDRKSLRTRILPIGPEDQLFRKPLWVNLHPRKKELEMIFLPAPYTNIRVHSCYKEDRVEIYYTDYTRFDEELDELVSESSLAIIKVVDLTEEEYAYLKRFV